jgi:SAM-dependent methyltransferase
MPDEKKLEHAYSHKYATARQIEESNDPVWWESAGRAYRVDILKALKTHNIRGKIVDFGAGWGHLCEMLLKNGYDCRGVELSDEMVEYCKKKKLPVEHGGIEILGKYKDISAIVMCAVFEHLTDHELWFQRFNRILSINGHLVSLHPTAAFFALAGKILRFGNRYKELPYLHGSFAPPWHTAYYSLKAMKIAARRNGFRVDGIQPVPQGRVGGLFGIGQIALEWINRVGWRIAGLRWPLITTHTFVMRKIKSIL